MMYYLRDEESNDDAEEEFVGVPAAAGLLAVLAGGPSPKPDVYLDVISGDGEERKDELDSALDAREHQYLRLAPRVAAN